MGTADMDIGERGSKCLDAGNVLGFGGTGGYFIWVGDVGYVPTHWEDLGRLPPQGGPQTDGAATTDGNGWYMGVPFADGGDGGGDGGGDDRPEGGGDLRHLLPEHSKKVNFDQAHYGPVSGDGAMNRDKGVSVVVGAGGLGPRGDTDSGSGGIIGGD